jgi:hypothetical protein
VIVQGRAGDPPVKVLWSDRHAVRIDGGRAYAALENDVIYLAMTIRNVGSGVALLHGYDLRPDLVLVNAEHRGPDQFRRLTIDLYIAAGDSGYWEGAVRDGEDPVRQDLAKAIAEREPFSVDLLYGDQEGGQRTITRFTVLPFGDDGWYCQAGRHWNLDRPDPR